MTDTESIEAADRAREALRTVDKAVEEANHYLTDAGYARRLQDEDERKRIEHADYCRAAAAFLVAAMHLYALDGPAWGGQPVTVDRQRHWLLAAAARKPVKEFLQLDGFPVGVNGGDDVMRPDDEGDCVFKGLDHELRNGTPVRVQIEEDVTAVDAARLLRKIALWIEADGDPVFGEMSLQPLAGPDDPWGGVVADPCPF